MNRGEGVIESLTPAEERRITAALDYEPPFPEQSPMDGASGPAPSEEKLEEIYEAQEDEENE